MVLLCYSLLLSMLACPVDSARVWSDQAKLGREEQRAVANVTGNDFKDGPTVCTRPGPWQEAWVQHRRACGTRDADVGERLGCSLVDFQLKKPVDPQANEQVRWVSDENPKQLRYHDSKTADPELSECGSSYAMPDYCSRAIISELSSVYDGTQRTSAGKEGALKHLFNSKDSHCAMSTTGWLYDQESQYNHLVSSDARSRSAFSFTQDWRQLYCLKYKRCKCTHGVDCSNDESVQCCRDMYQMFLDEHPKERAYYPKGLVHPSVPKIMVLATAKKSRLRLAWTAGRNDEPKVFLEHAAVFLKPEKFDLCRKHTVTVKDRTTMQIEFEDSLTPNVFKIKSIEHVVGFDDQKETLAEKQELADLFMKLIAIVTREHC